MKRMFAVLLLTLFVAGAAFADGSPMPPPIPPWGTAVAGVAFADGSPLPPPIPPKPPEV